MTDLTPDEMLERIKRGLSENSARFHPKVIVIDGLNAWGTFHRGLLDKLAAHAWDRTTSGGIHRTVWRLRLPTRLYATCCRSCAA